MDSIPQSPNPINTFDCTDAGNADRFVARYGGRFKFCTDEKCWYWWTGKHWKRVANEKLLNVAIKVARAIEQEIAGEARLSVELQDWAKRWERPELR